jgi:serine/threonine-protein kinase RsbW
MERTFEMYETFDSCRRSSKRFVNMLEALKRNVTVDDARFGYVHLCLYEIFTNSLYHGNKLDPSKKVNVHIKYQNGCITATIIDQGEGFNVSLLPNPTQGKYIANEHGRGVFITMHYADSVEFKQTERGFATTMQFNLR